MSDSQLQQVEALVRELYGELPALQGVLHVCSAVRAEPERWHVIAINASAPKSETDFFVLNFWRAYCDAILTTAQIARAEPQLSHELQGPLAEGLARYRRDVLRKPSPAWCTVLTRGTGIDPGHRMFADALPYVVLTAPEREAQLRAALGERAQVVARAELSARTALAFMRERGARTILLEAGPSTAGELYDAPVAIDHLLMSQCEAHVQPAAVGGALPADERMFTNMQRVSDVVRQEASGRWRFLRFQQRAVSP